MSHYSNTFKYLNIFVSIAILIFTLVFIIFHSISMDAQSSVSLNIYQYTSE